MLIYLIAILFSLSIGFIVQTLDYRYRPVTYDQYSDFSYRKNTIRGYFLILLIAFLPLFISAVRYMVGTDYGGTYTYDYYFIKAGFRGRLPLFSYWMYKISMFLSNDIQMYFVITSIFCVYLTIFAIYKYSVNPFYSLILYFTTYQYFTSMNGIRQMMATVVVFVGLKYLFNNKPIKFVLIVCIAALFHTSALFYLIFLLCYYVHLNFKSSIIFGAALAVLIMLSRKIIELAFSNTEYSVYINSNQFEYKASPLMFAICIITYLCAYMYKSNKNDRYNFWLNLQLVMLIVWLMQGVLSVGGRVFNLLAFYRLMFIPEISINMPDKRVRSLFNIGINTFYIAYTLYGMLVANWDTILPYMSFFNR